ncbi:MAG: hypothetical protein KAU12_03350, partial [Candidatus Omnitrophica bacterium]|nr:hypothetical protein [Candidatus Omnitrophota bacterium]
ACGIFDALEADNIFENECQICQEGINYILKKPEFNDIDKLRAILNVLEDKQTIEKILRGNLGPYKKVIVTIGKENKLKNLHNCSLVTSKYKIGNRVVGVLGLLGPTRMAYSRLLPLVEYMSDILSEALSGHGLDGSYEEGYDEA